MSALSSGDPSPRFRAASELSLRLVDWLWPGRLAVGQLAILEGDPGLGKSFLALDLCARLSTGRPWPDDAPAAAPAACVYLNGEDDEHATVGPRLRALGADLGRVFLLDRDDAEFASTLSLPTQVGALGQLVTQTRARLVVIDPVMHFLGPDVEVNTYAGARQALGPLTDLARRHACVVLLIRHLTKTEGGRALYRGLGSIGLLGVCRFAWLVAEEAEKPGRRVLAQVKNNLAPPQAALAFEVVQPADGSPALNWLGPVAATADELVRPVRRRGRPPVQRLNAMAFLKQELANGPRPVSEIWQRSVDLNMSSKTVYNASKDLAVRSEMVMEDNRRVTYWLLPGQALPGHDKPEEEMDVIERALKDMREKYPPKTPLERDDD
jgi:hypothetical protein